MLRRELRWGRIGPVDDDGIHEVDVLFELEHSALATALNLGDRVEVLEPTELREHVVIELHNTMALYMTP